MTTTPETTSNIETVRDEHIARILDLYYDPSQRTPEALREIALSLNDDVVRNVTLYYIGTVIEDQTMLIPMAEYLHDVLNNAPEEGTPNLFVISAVLAGCAGQYQTWIKSLMVAATQAPENRMVVTLTAMALAGVVPSEIRQLVRCITFEDARYPLDGE